MTEYLSLLAAALSIAVAAFSYFESVRARKQVRKHYSDLLASFARTLSLRPDLSPADLSEIKAKLDQVMIHTAGSVSALVDAPVTATVSLLTFENGQPFVSALATSGPPAPLHRKTPLFSSDAFAETLPSGKAVLINDLSGRKTASSERAAYQSLLVVPLTTSQSKPGSRHVLGFLSLSSPKKHAFARDGLAVAQSLAAVVTAILDPLSTPVAGEA